LPTAGRVRLGRSRGPAGSVRRCWPGWPQTGSTRWTCRPSWPPRVRLLSSGHGRKNDNADALSVGIAALTAPQLQTVQVDEAVAALRALVEHRDDLVRARTQTVNRLHALLTQLIPAGAPQSLTADIAAQLLSRVRPRAPLQRTLRRLAADLIGEIRRLDRRISTAGEDVAAAVTQAGCTLAELYGIGAQLAGKILARVGAIVRVRSAAAFAAFNGTTPIEVSSGDVVRHRLSRAGDRQLRGGDFTVQRARLNP
jgi:transposase